LALRFAAGQTLREELNGSISATDELHAKSAVSARQCLYGRYATKFPGPDFYSIHWLKVYSLQILWHPKNYQETAFFRMARTKPMAFMRATVIVVRKA
jgi:hypothetical protein